MLSGNIGCILARWQKWSKVSLKGSEVKVSGGKKRQKCRLRVPTGDVWRRKRPKVCRESSEVGCWAAKKANSVAVEGLWRGVVSE